MKSADAAKVCGPVVDDMAAALVAKTSYFNYLSDGFAIVATRVSPADAARAAHVLADAMNSATDANVRRDLASSLSKLAGRLAPTEAAQICGWCVRTLSSRTRSGGKRRRRRPVGVGTGGVGRPDGTSRGQSDLRTVLRARSRTHWLERQTRATAFSGLARWQLWQAEWTQPRPREFADWPPRFSRMRKQETPALAMNIAPGLSSLATSMDPSDGQRNVRLGRGLRDQSQFSRLEITSVNAERGERDGRDSTRPHRRSRYRGEPPQHGRSCTSLWSDCQSAVVPARPGAEHRFAQRVGFVAGKSRGEHGPSRCLTRLRQGNRHPCASASRPTARVRLDRPACREVTAETRSPDRKQAGA